MIRRPPRSTRTDTLFPYTTLFRSLWSPIGKDVHEPTNSDIIPDVYSRQLHGTRARKCRSEEHTSELQSLMRISYAVFCLKKKKNMVTLIFIMTDLNHIPILVTHSFKKVYAQSCSLIFQ